MILNPRTDIVLPELEEPLCCTNSFSDNGSEKKPAEYWQRHEQIADFVGIPTID